jgi:hypothetical protein
LTTLVDLDADPTLRLIASLDKSGTCVLSWLPNGGLVRSFEVEGSDSLERLILFSSGFVADLSVLETPTSKNTKLLIYGIDARKVAQIDFEGDVASWAKAEFDCRLSCLIVALKNRRFFIFRIPDLEQLTQLESESVITAIVFSAHLNAAVVSESSGAVSMVSFGRSGSSSRVSY